MLARTYSTWRDEWDRSSAGEFLFYHSPVSRADSDADGMPDYFERQHGFDCQDAADGARDADGEEAFWRGWLGDFATPTPLPLARDASLAPREAGAHAEHRHLLSEESTRGLERAARRRSEVTQ